MNYNFIKKLKNNNEMKYIDIENIFKIIINYYKKFYNIKFFNKKTKKRILNCIINRIFENTILKLKKFIFIKKIKIIIQKAILKSSPEKNDFSNKYYKFFI